MSGRVDRPPERPAASLPQLAVRAIRARCPHCGDAPVFASWFRRHERCAVCRLRLARPGPDYFTGAIFFTLALSEGLFAAILLVTVVSRWPDVPWDRLTWVAASGMLVAPILLHPLSQVVFLSLDIFWRPVTDDECVR